MGSITNKFLIINNKVVKILKFQISNNLTKLKIHKYFNKAKLNNNIRKMKI